MCVCQKSELEDDKRNQKLPDERSNLLITFDQQWWYSSLAHGFYFPLSVRLQSCELPVVLIHKQYYTSRRMNVVRNVSRIATPKMQKEGGGFLVRRVIGGVVPSCDPLLMLDHFGPVEYGPGEAIGAPDHPHRGFETVTYVIEGENQHQDSAGNKGILGPGWVQWMTAGSGVVHSEMPSDKVMKKGGRSEGFQLWVNLPAKDKMIPPRYQDTPPEKIPKVKTPDNEVEVHVIAGNSLGTQAYIETRIPIMYLDIRLQPGGSFTQPVPQSYNGFAYVWRGAGMLGNNQLPAKMGQVGLLGEKGDQFTVKAADDQECRVLLIAGEPIREPVAWYGPFVMNTEEELQQAFRDYRSGKLGAIPGSEARIKQTKAAAKKHEQNKVR